MLTITLILGACGNNTNDEANSAAPAETITVPQADQDVEVPVNPQNVVVFDYGVADTIRALGKGDQITGMVGNNAPEYIAEFAQAKEQIGGSLKEPNLEAISQLAPDLIIVSSRQVDFIDQLSDIAPVIEFNPDYTDYWGSITDQTQLLGEIFGETAAATEKLAEIETKAAEIRTRNEAAPGKNLILMSSSGSLSAYSSGSRFAFLIDTLGFSGVENVEASTHGQEISFEGVRALEPDRIFLVNRDAAMGNAGPDTATEILNNEVIADTKAAQNSQIYSLDPSLWYLSGGGLESMQLQMEEIENLTAN